MDLTAGENTPHGCLCVNSVHASSRYEPAALAALVHRISDGIAVQAAAGRSHDELRRVADLALRALLD